ncbi:MAG: MFS transporter [Dehalococcoidia bacterium]
MLITTTIVGSFLSFNVFLKYLLDDFGWSRGGTAAALSLAMVGQGLLSPVTGSLADRYGARPLVSVGAVLLGVAYFLLSRVGEMWQLYALYLMAGAGGATIFVPVVGAVSRRFQQRRGLALGVGVSGITLGTAIVPLSVAGVISVLGWRQAYVLLAVVIGVLVLALGQLMGGRPVADRGNTDNGHSLLQAVRTATFWKLLLAAGISLAGVHMVIAHLVTFATDLGLAAARGAFLVSLVGVAGFGGMLLMGNLSDRTGGRLPWVLSAGISVLALVSIITLRSQAAIYPFVVLFGFAWGGYAVMLPFLATEFFGMRSVAAVVGGVQLGSSVMAGSGPVMAGLIFDRTGSYYPAFGIGVALFMIGAALVFRMKPVPDVQDPRSGGPS